MSLNDVLNTPAQLLWEERLMLYALVRGLRPTNLLEIGSFYGGSAQLIHAAMIANGKGHLWCVDINPVNEGRKTIEGLRWAELHIGNSSEVIPALGVNFDFFFIDGDHSCAGVTADIQACRPLCTPKAVLIFHDAFHEAIKRAIDDNLDGFVDCGILSIYGNNDSYGSAWAGLRMLRKAW